MTPKQKLIKYLALAFAVFLIVSLALGAFGIIDAVLGTNIRFPARDDHFGFVPVSDSVTSVDVDISSAELRIVTGDSFSISSHNDSVTFSENGTRLTVTDGKKISFSSEGLVIIRIPEDKVFERVEISAGAGEIDVERLNTGILKMNLGAADIHIEDVYVTKEAHVSCAAGELTIKNGSINNFEADFSVIDARIQCELTGKSEIDFGIGEISLILPGTRDSYRFSIDKGVASAKLNGNSIKDSQTYGEGASIIDIDGAVGSITIKTE